MVDDRRGEWRWFGTRDAARNAGAKYRVLNIDWQDPGWYWFEDWTQRCPRNCCYESACSAVTAAVRVKEIAERMTELAGELREARARASGAKAATAP